MILVRSFYAGLGLAVAVFACASAAIGNWEVAIWQVSTAAGLFKMWAADELISAQRNLLAEYRKMLWGDGE